MERNRAILGTGFLIALGAGLFVFISHLHYGPMPLMALAVGALLYQLNPRYALRIYLFSLPWCAALPALIPNGYPFNYMAVPLFILSGMILVSMANRESLDTDHPVMRVAVLLLVLTLISVTALMIRWSNLTIPGNAFMRDTLISPDGQRLSFGIIFPVITLLLSAVSPHLVLLLHRHGVPKKSAFHWLFAGYAVSLAIALIQKFMIEGFLSRPYFVLHDQINGGASDFNAFGFMSGFVFLLAVVTWTSGTKGAMTRRTGFAYAALLSGSLYGLILSGSRTGFLFILAAIPVILFSKRWSVRMRSGILVSGLVLLVLGGGVLRHRIANTISGFTGTLSQDGLFSAVDKASNQRLTMVRSAAGIFAMAPLGGVGGGNFLFALKHLHHGESHLEDLPLNQFLLLFCETGIPGGLLFILLLILVIHAAKASPLKPLLWTVLLAFLVGTPLWLPELNVLFWFLVWAMIPPRPSPAPHRKRHSILAFGLIGFFVLGNGIEFSHIHPLQWARKRNVPYDYGFWPEDPDMKGTRFRWTHQAAGIYIPPQTRLDANIIAQAPFSHLPEGIQKVDLFWRGKRIHSRRFDSPGPWPLRFQNREGGFLEIRVHPVFNLKKMGLGPEGRTLGIQVQGLPD